MHHQMDIDMSKSILKYTQEEKVRTLAQNIINTQEKEITTMQNAFHSCFNLNFIGKYDTRYSNTNLNK